MSPQHVREIEDRGSPRGTRVDHGEQGLNETIQVTRGNRPPTHLQRFITRVPPGVPDPCGNDSGLSGWYINLLTSDPDSEPSRFHEDRFARIKMYVERR